LEVSQNYPEVHAVYEKFLEALRHSLEELEEQVNENAGNISNQSSQESQQNESQLINANGSFSEDKPPRSKDLKERQKEYGLAFIMFMRFARRAEGVQASRTLFGKARRDRWTSWQVYEAAGNYITWTVLLSLALILLVSAFRISLHARCFGCGSNIFKGSRAIYFGTRFCRSLLEFSALYQR
jgi:hypothetical protein